MQRAAPRLARSTPPDTRIVTLAVAAIALLLLAVSVYYLDQFRVQRAEARSNAQILNAWDQQLLTATPAAQEAGLLESQLTEAQQQFGEASELLPSSDIDEDAVFERVSQAARLSGVTLLTTSQSDPPMQDGNLVYKYFTVAARGSLERLTNFATRLEEEAFPSAFFSDDATVVTDATGDYTLAGTLTIVTYLTSTGNIAIPAPIPPGGNSPEALRSLAAEAMERRDYELAISYLLRLAATEPPPADINDLLYDAYLAYGNDLLSRGFASAAEEQCSAAQSLQPNSPDAAACLLTAAQMITPTPGGEVVVVVPTTTQGQDTSPTNTPEPPPTVAPPPTRTAPPPTVPLPPTNPPQPTTPPQPTNTPEPTVTPSVTGTPPTATPPPTTTLPAGGDGNPFGPLSTFYLPNCGLTAVKGTIRDYRTGANVNGVTVRVWWDGAPDNAVYSRPSGTDPTKGGGEWDVVLESFPKAGRWYVQVVNPETGATLSERVTVETDTGPCETGQSGRQVVIQDFYRYEGNTGTTVPSATPSRVPGSPTVVGTPTMTPTPSNTPTITPTPTQLPVTYDKDENPNVPIPDGPNGQYISNLVINDAVILREARVYLTITHEDAGDLDIWLIHPDGTRIQLHAQGQDQGTEDIRRWFNIEGGALAAIRNKSIQGTWRLEVNDQVEAKTGELLSWTFQVYP